MAIVSWLVAGGLFAWVVVELLIASARGVETTSASSETDADHRTAVLCFVLVWILYPVISLVSLVMIVLNNYRDSMPLSTEWVVLKDTGYAVLDVVSKAGLALYITLYTMSR